MRRFFLLAALATLLALPASAQRVGFASINSWGASQLGPAPASVLSPQPLVQGPYSRGYSYQQPGRRTYAPPPSPRLHGGNHCRNCGYTPIYPAYYPYYWFGYTEPVTIETSSPMNGGTFDRYNEAPAEEETPAPTVFENRRPASNSSRYGEHYTDSREQQVASAEPAPAVAANESENNDLQTVLIFKDGQEMEVSNFAIMGDYVFVFTGNRRKIPLSELDLGATQKANEDRGTEFNVPTR